MQGILKTHRVQSVHQVLHLAAMCQRVDEGQENRPSRAENQKAHPRFLGEAPPLVLFLEIDEGIDAQDQLGHCESEDDAEDDAARNARLAFRGRIYQNHHYRALGVCTYGICQLIPCELFLRSSPLVFFDLPNMMLSYSSVLIG